ANGGGLLVIVAGEHVPMLLADTAVQVVDGLRPAAARYLAATVVLRGLLGAGPGRLAADFAAQPLGALDPHPLAGGQVDGLPAAVAALGIDAALSELVADLGGVHRPDLHLALLHGSSPYLGRTTVMWIWLPSTIGRTVPSLLVSRPQSRNRSAWHSDSSPSP